MVQGSGHAQGGSRHRADLKPVAKGLRASGLG